MGTLDRQRDLYVDLDDRIRELERNMQSRPATVANGNLTVPGQLPVPNGGDRENYEAAFEITQGTAI